MSFTKSAEALKAKRAPEHAPVSAQEALSLSKAVKRPVDPKDSNLIKELRVGIGVEAEHKFTLGPGKEHPEKYTQIAWNHIDEDKHYYKKLAPNQMKKVTK